MFSLGIIPARSGSKRVKDKNIKNFNGQPLIIRTLEEAINSNLDYTVVSTNSKEYAEIIWDYIEDLIAYSDYDSSLRNRFDILIRPEELAQDHVQTDEVVLHVLRQVQLLGYNPRALCLLQPTSPLRNSTHINEALKVYKENQPCTVVAGHFADGFYWIPDFDNNPNGDIDIFPIEREPRLRVGTQWIMNSEKLFQENGAIYITDAAKMSVSKTKFNEPFIAYPMNEKFSVDIDTEQDWQKAEELSWELSLFTAESQ